LNNAGGAGAAAGSIRRGGKLMRDTLHATVKPQGFVLTGWHILLLFIAFFGVIITVNLIMARAAVTNWTGLVVKNSYVASQQFNDKIAAHDEIAALGWRESARADNGQFLWSVTDADGKTVAARKITVLFTRPIGEKDDATIIAGPLADGTFAPIPFPAPGRWNVTVRAEIEGVAGLESIHRFEVKPGA
jgi:nitrogen fixation protein FixH